MKLFARMIIFALTFFLGTAAASIGRAVKPAASSQPVKIAELAPENVAADTSAGIRVTYLGSGAAEVQEPYLRFRIYNGLDLPVTYSAHSAESPWPQLKLNGRDMPHRWRCGTGMETFTVSPGNSAEVHVYRHEFLVRPRPGDLVTVGFHLRRTLATESSVYSTEPFQLPHSFKVSI